MKLWGQRRPACVQRSTARGYCELYALLPLPDSRTVQTTVWVYRAPARDRNGDPVDADDNPVSLYGGTTAALLEPSAE